MLKSVMTAGAILFLWAAFSGAQEMTAPEIIQKANDLLNQETVFAKAKMTIMTTSGQERELYYDSWSKDRGEKSLIRYTGPRRVKDQAMLMLNNSDDIWSYFPRTNRVRKLATHAKKQKMQGSDFSYEDMGSGDSFIKDFTPARKEDEKKSNRDCFKLELTKKPDVDSNYSRMIAWIDKENYVIWAIDYYDEKDSSMRIKTLLQTDLKVIDNVPTPLKMTMKNHLDNTETVNELQEVKYNLPLDDAMFTERGLKK
jgi:outer membrane lipoprotein-sorting protein